MKFRHETGVRLALTTGHVTFVGPEWKELDPRYREEAMKAGCEIDLQTIPDLRTDETPPPPTRTLQNGDTVSILRAALIRMIERNADGDFTTQGLPNLNTLRKEAGIEIDRELAIETFNALQAEAEND